MFKSSAAACKQQPTWSEEGAGVGDVDENGAALPSRRLAATVYGWGLWAGSREGGGYQVAAGQAMPPAATIATAQVCQGGMCGAPQPTALVLVSAHGSAMEAGCVQDQIASKNVLVWCKQ